MYASWKVASTFWLKSWSQTWIIEPCRSEVSVLWVDWVEYTRTRARAGSGSEPPLQQHLVVRGIDRADLGGLAS